MSTLSKKEALEQAMIALDNKYLDHVRFEGALNLIKAAIKYPNETKLLCVIGPTGVGKSKLYRETKRFVDDYAKGLPVPLAVPCVAFEVPQVNQYNFSWPTFYEHYLKALQPPLPPDKRVLKELLGTSQYRSNDTKLMNALENRRPLVTLLDEAQHLTQISNSRHWLNHMEHIKSLANRSNVLHVCFGTYDLARMINLSGQLARRTRVIHFSRYSIGSSREDATEFSNIVQKCQRVINIAHFIDLRQHRPYLYRHSAGCVGTLKQWILSALQHALAEGRDAVKIEDLKATELTDRALYTMINEITEGEKNLSSKLDTHDYKQLQILLGDDLPVEEMRPPNSGSDLAGQVKKQSVGEPSPRRLPIQPLFDDERDQMRIA
jgi:hypothetical protein